MAGIGREDKQEAGTERDSGGEGVERDEIERQFWLTIRRALMMICKVIETRYK